MDLSRILEVEKSVAGMICELKEQIVKEVAETPQKDVEVLGKNIVVIKFSKLKRSIWTPEYYIPSVQAEYIRKALDSISTAHSFVKKMDEMLEKRGVKIGAIFHPLNDDAISILEKYYSRVK